MRRRSKFRTIRRTLDVVVALFFLTVASGFCWGMWAEVGRSPRVYRDRPVDTSRSTIALWSIKAGHYVADMQIEEPQRPDPFTTAWNNQEEIPLPDAAKIQPDRALPRPVKTTPTTRPPDVMIDPLETGGPSYPDMTEPKPKNTTQPEIKIDPPKTTPKVKVDPPKSNPEVTEPVPARDRLDAKSRALLDKAHKLFDIGWKYHLRSRPDAPQSGRRAALIQTIKYFKASKKYYEAVVDRKPPKDIRSQVVQRLVDINRMLFWSYKHLSAR